MTAREVSGGNRKMALYQDFERVSKNCPFIWKALCLGPRKSSPHILHMMAMNAVVSSTLATPQLTIIMVKYRVERYSDS